MYAALWRRLPGPPWLKVLELTAVVVVILAVLMGWVFPSIERALEVDQPTSGVPASSASR
jgi:hypothetical protein